jgi:hypothetical protein
MFIAQYLLCIGLSCTVVEYQNWQVFKDKESCEAKTEETILEVVALLSATNIKVAAIRCVDKSNSNVKHR